MAKEVRTAHIYPLCVHSGLYPRDYSEEITLTKIDYASTSLGSSESDQLFEQHLRAVRSREAIPSPVIHGTSSTTTGDIIDRHDPVCGAVVGRAHCAGPEEVDAAVAAASGAAKAWRNTPFQRRNELLLEVADRIDDRLHEIAALISAETGKTRLEAVGETQETVDIIRHYTAEVERNDGFVLQQASTPTELNFDLLRPYGVFAVIAPFNFPVALTVGMSVGALATGNTVVVKPSEKTPGSTSTVVQILCETLPPGVVNLINGRGDVGRMLAEHDDVDGIAFTGSAKVGWSLTEITGRSGAPKPVLAEMGGQNPAVVSRHADLDAAARGIVRSAFGLSGQKCSACRRVVVEESVADDLTRRIRALASDLVVGDPLDPATDLGPLIDDEIAARVDEAITAARASGATVTGGRVDGPIANSFSLVVITDLPHGHALTREELFAPVLTVSAVPDFTAAIAEANAVPYGLSAGVFSEDDAEVAQFLDEIESGVLYVNRAAGATTGAWPGVQSFCGWKMSGTAGKGGLGIWYLPGFMREQNRTISVPA